MGTQNTASPQKAAADGLDPHLRQVASGPAGGESGDLPDNIRRTTADAALALLGTGPGGLTDKEAAERQRRYGKNLIESARKRSPVLAFLSNFTHLMAILLWVAGAIAFVAGLPELGCAVWLVNIINGVFSFWQEHRASQATEALKKMLPAYANVIRGGREQKVLAEDLVPGDIMLLAEGDRISADARVIASSDLQVNQSTLNGESNPSRKTSDAVPEDGLTPAEIPNLVFAGTSVSEGNGRAAVLRIGMATEFGKIANLTQNMEEVRSPLQRDLDRLTKQVTVFAMCMGLAFFSLSLFVVHEPFAQSFIFALGMVVAFIPEGLLPTVTLSLAMAVQRMSRRNALVKKLDSVEALGSTSVICTDKTGTLTQNEMTVNHLWTVSREYGVTGVGYAPEGRIESEGAAYRAVDDPDLELLLEGGLLCGNARLRAPEEEGRRYEVYGDPTEACLIVSAQKGGIDPAELERRMPRVKELPFESRRKRMTTVHALEEPVDGATRVAFTKGAPNEVVRLADRVRVGGRVVPMTDGMRERIMAANDAYAADGLRVLAVAYRALGADAAGEGVPASLSAYTPDVIERHLTFVGLEAMMDPPRPEVAAAVAECRRAGIRIVMITGDYGLTAASIARRIGIVEGDDLSVISGFELSKMGDEELRAKLSGQVVFARMAPEQKLRVVSALQEMGEIVAVTGDGPALKKADIGVAMGVAGTDVAKEAADMILTDDNFASIVAAIEEGRAVYSNIRKFLLYILNSNAPEAVPNAVYLLSGGAVPLPLTTMQILTIDLGTDMLPALGLGTEPPEATVMDQPPRDPNERLLNRRVLVKAFLWYGLMGSAAAMVGYFLVNLLNGWPAVPLAGEGDPVYIQATTMTLAGIVFAQIGQVMNCRTERTSVFKIGLLSNRQIVVGIVFEVALIVFLTVFPPLQGVFHTAPLGWQDYVFLCCIPPVVVAIEEARKAWLRRRAARRRDGGSAR